MKGSDRYPVGGVACLQAGCTLPVANLSVGGFFVVSEDPPSRGETLDVELLLPWGSTVAVSGRVAWINASQARSAAGLPAGYGVKLERVSLYARMQMLKALREAGGIGQRRGTVSEPFDLTRPSRRAGDH